MALDRKFILVIDDSSTIRTLVAEMLSQHSYQTLESETVELVLIDMERIKFDLVVIDIFMPGMGGIEGIARIREKWPDVKIIAISAGVGEMDKEKALRAAALQGADMTLAKPFTEEELIGAIDELLSGSGSEGWSESEAAAG